LNLHPKSRQAMILLAVAPIANYAALQMRCILGAFNGSNRH